jgi:hypothetical protein
MTLQNLSAKYFYSGLDKIKILTNMKVLKICTVFLLEKQQGKLPNASFFKNRCGKTEEK